MKKENYCKIKEIAEKRRRRRRRRRERERERDFEGGVFK